MKPDFLLEILHNIQGHILVIDEDHRIMFADNDPSAPSVSSDNGHSSSLIGSDYAKYELIKNLKKKDQERIASEIEKIFTAKKNQFEGVFEIKDSKSGRWLQFKLNGFDHLSKKCALIQYKDITEIKRNEEALKESEVKYKDAFNSMTDVYTRSDMDGKCLMISPSIFNMMGYKTEEIMGRNLADFYVDPSQRNEIVDQLLKSQTVENFEIEVVRKDGQTITVSSNTKLYYNDKGDALGVEGIFRDITDKKRAASEHDKLFNVSFDLLSITGFDGYFKEINPFWEQVTGYSMKELYSKPFIKFIHPDDVDKTAAEVEELLKGKRATIGFENRYITKSGKEIHLSWTVTPAPQEKLMYSVARDITEQKQSEIKVQQYQKRLKGLAKELTISEENIRKQIAVDLHDHVGQLLASMRMQMARITDMEENPELIVRMKSISQGLLKSIQATRAAIFDLSPPQLNEIGLIAATHDWMKEQIEQKHDIKTVISSDREIFKLDENTRVLLFRSLKELMMNTVKHARASKLTIAFKTKGNMLETTIEDDGSGFDYNPDLLRLKSNSYGLFSIQERMSDLGGSMEADAVIERGTLIKLTVPLSEKSL